MLTPPTVDDLATFTGRPVATFTTFADQALARATLLFSTLTKRDDYPDDANGRQLAYNAILELADRIYLEQPYTEVKASPFQSETLGSYSYSKILQNTQQGKPTGLSWWDIAIEELTLTPRSLVVSGSVSAFERVITTNDDGQREICGPADNSLPDLPFDINTENVRRDPPR